MVLKIKKSLVLLILLGFASCDSNSSYEKVSEASNSDQPVDGRKLYFRNCTTCHGADGKQGYSGAKDLSKSTMSDEEIVEIIVNGKNGMMPYRTILKTQKEREAVKDFVKTLRK